MSATATPTVKGGKTNITESKYDAENMIPLILATLGNPSLSYKIMAALDPQGRTEAAFQHRFRSWRKEGIALAEAKPDVALTAVTTPAKKRAPAAKKNENRNRNGKGKAKQADVVDEEGEAEEDSAEAVAIKKQEDDRISHPNVENGKTAIRAQAGRKASFSATDGTNGNKKRAGSKDTEVGDEEDGASAKKAKVTKKGTATVVKKKGVKAREFLESVGDEEDEANTPSKAKPKRKPAAKVRAKAAVKEEEKLVKKWKAEPMVQEGKIALKEDGEGLQDGLVGEDGLGGEGEEMVGKVEMEFELEGV